MFIERKINSAGEIELWACEWENVAGQDARKVFIRKIGIEEPVTHEAGNEMSEASAICWSYGRTVGNIAVFTQSILGSFPARSGSDARVPCNIVAAGKFRHGAERWWCRTHQAHWGTKADFQAFEQSGSFVCASHDQLLNYVLEPFEIRLADFSSVGVWCSMPAAISTRPISESRPKIHVHVRQGEGKKKVVDGDYDAIAILYSDNENLYGAQDITRVNITPPAAFEFVQALEDGRKMECISCSYCKYPHLDLGDFARVPHRKHFCGNCGRDSTWSREKIISNPLMPVHDQYSYAGKFIEPRRSLNLDDHAGCDYTVWASTPAIVWTAERPQERGIHVHIDDGEERVVDETYSSVTLNGVELSRSDLLAESTRPVNPGPVFQRSASRTGQERAFVAAQCLGVSSCIRSAG